MRAELPAAVVVERSVTVLVVDDVGTSQSAIPIRITAKPTTTSTTRHPFMR